MRFAFADAFDLGRVQRINHPASLTLTLVAHAACEREFLREQTSNAGLPLILRTMSRVVRPR
jgi:hypothetical protein